MPATAVPPYPADVTPSADLNIFARLTQWQLPSRGDCLYTLHQTNEIVALVMIAAGAVFLLNGWKAYKGIIIVNAVAIGMALGRHFGAMAAKERMEIFGAIAGALLLGVLAWAVVKGAIGVMSALAGGIAGYGLWVYAMHLANKPALAAQAPIGAALGVISFGLLGLLNTRVMVMIFTAIQGSLMAVSGGLALLLKPNVWPPMENHLRNNIHMLPLLLATPAVLGLSLQYVASAKKNKKKGSE